MPQFLHQTNFNFNLQSPLNHTTSVSITSSTSGRTPPRTKSISELSLMKSRSRENIARSFEPAPPGGTTTPAAGDDAIAGGAAPELSYHMARPATVISNPSTGSSSNPSIASADSSNRNR